MLEIRHVTKTYTPKHGVPVKALNDVSLKFEDKGMVFILGKSGSGKSTLLNVLGGLDRADSGEFIIKGKSSNNFSQSDFDSYRNTFIGFIFQEYNILPEFTVGANIALAMQLQGKKATPEALNAILDEVDLTGYGNRKPNELSGGQNQRVAIARALVKNPEMIMADEPTGALDSKTGKQVFDTLKKLSRDKLVLIVSHDRDFAELYADRIIELKDGVVISDVSKTSTSPAEFSEGVSAVDDKVLHIKKGYKLTARDLDLINEYIAKADGDTIISTDEKENVEIKKVLKINDNGGKDTFTDTNPDDVKMKNYTPQDSKLVRSHLPFRNSLRIGASSLKVKPFRLIFTILLCVVAFAMFGLTDTMAAYDKYTTYEHSIADSKINAAAFTKSRFRSYDDDYDAVVDDDAPVKDEKRGYFNEVLMGKDDAAKIENEMGIHMLPVYSGGLWNSPSFRNSIADNSALSSENGTLYNGNLAGLCEITRAQFDQTGLMIVAGDVPKTTGEMMITKVIYDHFAIAGLRTDVSDPKFKPASPAAIIGKTINVSISTNEMTFRICGVVDTEFDTTKYADYLPGAQKKDANITDIITTQELETRLRYGYHTLGFVVPGTVDMIEASRNSVSYAPSNSKDVGSANFNLSLESKSGKYSNFNYVANLSALAGNDSEAIIWTNDAKSTLAEGEVIAPLYIPDIEAQSDCSQALADKLIAAGYYESYESDSITSTLLRDLIYNIRPRAVKKGTADEYPEKGYPDEFAEYAVGKGMIPSGLPDSEIASYYRDWLTNTNKDGGYVRNAYGGKPGYHYERQMLNVIVGYFGANNDSIGTSGTMYVSENNGGSSRRVNYTVVGYYLPSPAFVVDYENYYELGTIAGGGNMPLIVSDEVYGTISKSNAIYSFCVGRMPYDDAAAVRKIVKFNYTNFGRIRYQLNNEVSNMLELMNNMVETLSQVFLYVGIGFAVFAALMLFNFISVSISYKKREIGILRAVGARGADVFGIFFNESMIITLINWVLASVATVLGASAINNSLRGGTGFTLTLLNVGIRQFALILGVGVLVAFISTFLPVLRISRKRPIDAIRNR